MKIVEIIIFCFELSCLKKALKMSHTWDKKHITLEAKVFKCIFKGEIKNADGKEDLFYSNYFCCTFRTVLVT